jgi:prevent-host-death family protein
MSTLSISVPLAEAKRTLPELVDRVSRGEEFVLTRHGVEVARLIPASRPSREEVSVAIARMRATRPGRTVPAAELRAWRTAGRR